MSAGSSSAAGPGWRAFQRSSPAMASALLAARATSISGMDERRRPVGPLAFPGAGGGTSGPAPDPDVGAERLLLGCTRGCSPDCFSKCGGQGASGSPAASSAAASSSSRPSQPAVASMPSPGSPISAYRRGTVSMVNAAGSQSATSSQCSGADTRASGTGRTE